ncbi:MAG TPA: SEC-C domain-containing protein [Symbiobacteriaceae bacterium]|nr:SEC-C domain-containing protein [Symbiobacteriaceae bacterium]
MIGRNDLCPCGSGKKFKKCCLQQEQVISLQALRETRTYDGLMDRLLQSAALSPEDESVMEVVFRFFGGPPEGVEEEDLDLTLDWAVFTYIWPEHGTTRCEYFAETSGDLSDEERAVVAGWAKASPGFFRVVSAGSREMSLLRLGDMRHFTVNGSAGAYKPGEFLMAWLLPVPSGFRFGVTVSPLPPGIDRSLERLVRAEYGLLRRQKPDATWDELYRELWPRLVEDVGIAMGYGDSLPDVDTAGPAVQGAPTADFRYVAVAHRLVGVLKQADMEASEIAGVLRLWWDAAHALRPRLMKVEPWVGAVIYLYGRTGGPFSPTQAELAAALGTSASSIGGRAQEMDAALQVSLTDPRYVDLLEPTVRMVWRLRFESLP